MKSALRATVYQGSQLKNRGVKRYNSPPISLYQGPPPSVLYSNCSRVKINVSGMMYETFESTLARFPHTLLGCPVKRGKYFDSKRDEYFFNRNRNAFDAILFFYQSDGLLVRPDTVPLKEFCNEMEFFEMGEDIVKSYMRDQGIILEDADQKDLPSNPTMRTVWLWLEYPNSSDSAKLVACWSIMFILISIFVICAETIPPGNPEELISEATFTLYSCLELACVAWFTMELIMRVISCPNKLKFAMDFSNYIDLAAILPYFVENAIQSAADYVELMNAFRLLRVFRIFKLARHMEELKILGRTIIATWRELMMILFFILISMVMFSGCTYYAEFDAQPDGVFSSIPDTAWFVIVTLTNVGYGDAVPVTPIGKLLGTMCALVGVLAIALPSPVIATRFKQFYDAEKIRKNEIEPQ
ncbi:potassium voltage-gated channel subfamily A member 1 [Nematostella vectensis]|uniref:potassium voltage-gated channel subfamily A member 1 n=1 Tax=Nematostella vectensis TaxID=45351 RepID=UPI0020772970|nr:potassium voltage-gated channel subfamily A member 1 [Nematostella vectensis]